MENCVYKMPCQMALVWVWHRDKMHTCGARALRVYRYDHVEVGDLSVCMNIASLRICLGLCKV